MDTTDAPTMSGEPIFQQMVSEADDAIRSALTPAQPPKPDVEPPDNEGS